MRTLCVCGNVCRKLLTKRVPVGRCACWCAFSFVVSRLAVTNLVKVRRHIAKLRVAVLSADLNAASATMQRQPFAGASPLRARSDDFVKKGFTPSVHCAGVYLSFVEDVENELDLFPTHTSSSSDKQADKQTDAQESQLGLRKIGRVLAPEPSRTPDFQTKPVSRSHLTHCSHPSFMLPVPSRAVTVTLSAGSTSKVPLGC